MPAATGPTTKANEPYFEVAQENGAWHWQLWSGNGRPLARNPEGYPDKKHCLQALKLVAANVTKARLIVQAGEE